MSDSADSARNELSRLENEVSTPGLPPSGDVPSMAEMWKMMQSAMRETKEGLEAKLAERDEKIAQQETAISKLEKYSNTESQYFNEGGDFLLYTNLEKILPRLIENCKGNEEDIRKVKAWADKHDVKGNIRIVVANTIGAATGAAIGGAVAIAAHCGLKVGAIVAGAGITAGPACGFVFGGVAAGLIIVLVGYGIYKYIQYRKAEKIKKERGQIDDALLKNILETENVDVSATAGLVANMQ